MAELIDRAGIFVGDPARLAFAQRVMTETMQCLVDRYTARSADSTAHKRTKNHSRRS